MLLFEMPGGFEWLVILGVVLGVIIVLLIPFIFYLITLQSTLNLVSEKNRKMPSGQVWLLLIPIFRWVWHFIVVSRLADSIKAEANERNLQVQEQRPAYDLGLVMCILLIVLPFIGFVCWIVYWVKINGYKNLLLAAK